MPPMRLQRLPRAACAPFGGLPSGIYSPAVDDGIYVHLNPLAVGPHTLDIRAENPSQGFALDVTYNLTVVPIVENWLVATAALATARSIRRGAEIAIPCPQIRPPPWAAPCAGLARVGMARPLHESVILNGGVYRVSVTVSMERGRRLGVELEHTFRCPLARPVTLHVA